MKLRKDISTFGLLFAAVGGIVGSGWLLGPLYVAQIAGPAAIVAWAIGGILMITIALTFAELATTFPVAGGMVRFAQFSHGTFASFTMAWIAWLAAVMVAPIETMAAVQYASNYIPGITHTLDGSVKLTTLGIAIAGAVMLLMCFINSFAVKIFSKINNSIVIWKLAIPIITGLVLIHSRFNISHFTQFGGFNPYGWKGILTALPTAGVVYSFIGYSPAIQLAGEAKNPQRAIPIAILGAIAITIFLYVFIEIAFIGAVSSHHLTNGWRHLSFSGDAGPIAGILSALGVGWLLKIIYFDALISPTDTAFIYTASTARINIAMSQNKYLPSWMKKLNKHGSPIFAIGANYIVGMIFFLPFPGWQSMVGFIVTCFILAYAIGPISCAALRRLEPDAHRPFRVPAYKWFCLLSFYICNLIVYWTGWHVISKMLITIVIGYIVLIIQRTTTKNKTPLNFKNGVWLIPYLLGIGIISYLGAFSGRNIITFGMDFLVIACFSTVIYFYALYCSKDMKRPPLVFEKTPSTIS